MKKNQLKKKEEVVKKRFKTLTEQSEPKPQVTRNCIRAFIVGGAICVIGQIITNILMRFGFTKDEVSAITSVIMVLIGALLTGVGIYDKIANYGGAGTVVPITGFANAVVAPAIEFKKEGFVFGVAAKMFTIAGPVLVYGIGSSVIIGIIYYIKDLF
ncbi:stage V sporulation protein AC [Clostridium moniliforme]|uniref:Stage V sporulation protein AC n=1 Tax=Clostridium moniliforme TaxID=39489 RepID=A0ABS4EZT3_9CLOT|nr:stage V sporulation protein AC [Clostridium moniliforme]MBP1889501.1 stage V sporulation protein AC [Clostridium moniliforme]